MRIASWHLTEMPGSRTVHLLLTQLHNAVYYYYFLNFTFIIFSATQMMMIWTINLYMYKTTTF